MKKIAIILFTILAAFAVALSISFGNFGSALFTVGLVFIAINMFYNKTSFAVICGEMTADIEEDCDALLIGGTDDRLILINFGDIDGITRNVSNSQLIELITLASGKEAHFVQGKNLSNEPVYNLVNNRYFKGVSHEVRFKAFSNTPESKQQIENIKDGLFVAIIENKYRGVDGNAAFEVYGLDIGLELVEATRNPNDSDTGGAHDLLLQTPEETPEGHLPATFFDTNYNTTKAIIDALLV